VEEKMAETKPRKSPVRWTEQELTKLVEDVAMLRLEDPEPALLSLVNRAQQGWAASRRRVVTALRQLPADFVSRVKGAVSLLTQREPVAPLPAPPPPPAPPPTLGELAAGLVAGLEALVRRVEAATGTKPEVAPVPVAQPRHIPEPPITNGASRPRKRLVIAVVGLLGSQANELAERTKFLGIDLRCVNKEIRSPTFPAGTDEVVLFTKFIDHGWQDAAFNQFGHDRVHRHAGGIEQAAKLIEKVVVKRRSEANDNLS
jgi:hypothetical protein